jgi:hypothetical protein
MLPVDELLIAACGGMQEAERKAAAARPRPGSVDIIGDLSLDEGQVRAARV